MGLDREVVDVGRWSEFNGRQAGPTLNVRENFDNVGSSQQQADKQLLYIVLLHGEPCHQCMRTFQSLQCHSHTITAHSLAKNY